MGNSLSVAPIQTEAFVAWAGSASPVEPPPAGRVESDDALFMTRDPLAATLFDACGLRKDLPGDWSVTAANYDALVAKLCMADAAKFVDQNTWGHIHDTLRIREQMAVAGNSHFVRGTALANAAYCALNANDEETAALGKRTFDAMIARCVDFDVHK